MIDFSRAFGLAWERMIVILFQPLDTAKWALLGFNAFLVLLGEGDIQFNQPISFTQHTTMDWTSQTLPGFIHNSKQWLESMRALAEGTTLAWYLILAIAYIAGWLVLNWVGSRGPFLFIDNIVRNRAAFAGPWRRYAREGNTWFVFQLGLTFLLYTLLILSFGLFLAIDWAWISQERNPQGAELAALAVFFIAAALFWCVFGSLLFIVRSFTVALMFRQDYGLGRALGAVIHLLLSRPLSMIAYVLASALLSFIGAVLGAILFCLICCCIFWVPLIPIVGSLLLSALLAQFLLPLLVYYRCFQLECLSQFGPQYDVWSVDIRPASAQS